MKYTKNVNSTKTDIWALLPVLIGLCLIPLIVLTHDYSTNFSSFVWFNTSEVDQIDSFEYTKGIFVIITGIIALVVLAINEYMKMSASRKATGRKQRAISKWVPFENADRIVCILLVVYLVMIIISSLFSKYPDLAFHGGGYGQWQTMWVLLAYGILFFYAYTFINTENRGVLLVKCMMVTTALMAFTGTMQRFGHNPLKWDWVQKTITSYSKVSGISFTEGISDVILTFNNPNYVGSYVALVFPVAVSFIFIKASDDKKKMIACKIAGILIAAGLIISLSGAGSSAGGIAVAAGIVFAAILLLSRFLAKDTPEDSKTDTDKMEQEKKNNKKYLMIGGAVIVVVVIAGVLVTKTAFFQNTVNKLLQGGEDTRNIASIVNEDSNELTITLRNDEVLHLAPVLDESKNLSFRAYDEQKKEIRVPYNQEQNYFTIEDERFRMITINATNFSVGQDVYIGFKFNDAPNSITWSFMYVDGEWNYYTPFGKFMKLHEVESFGFEDYQNIANRRGFIWSRTIPLMKQYWFKGIGPNAFIIAFPNDDFVGSKRVGGSTTLVDKPHNAFLQMFVQTGGISAIAYAGLWIIYMIGGIRLFWKRKQYTNIEIAGMGLFVGIFSFAVSGITNDTVIGSQVIYWILLGTGYAVNRTIKSKSN